MGNHFLAPMSFQELTEGKFIQILRLRLWLAMNSNIVYFSEQQISTKQPAFQISHADIQRIRYHLNIITNNFQNHS